MTHESKHRGHLLQVQTSQRRNASFNAPSYERPQTQIRFARPFPARKVLGFRERQAQTELSQQGANRTADSRKNGGIQRFDCRNDREYTVETLVSHFHNQVRCATVVELYDKLIDDMKRGGKLGNAGVYKYSRTSLLKFTGQRLQIPFSDIDAVWLRRYENWLRTSGCGDTTISQLFRTLRSVFNKAVELQLVKRDYYPFDAYKVSKFDTRTKKRAIAKEDVRKVIALDLSQGYPSERLARDIFVFSYFGAGINFADIALLKYGNVRDGRVQYVRKKTGKPINFLLTEEMRNIIVKYQQQGQTDEDYIFPILDRRVHRTEQQRYDRTHKVLTNTNRWLRKIGQRVGIEHLTTYVARHTFATVLKRSGVNIAIISESLGHSDLSTTQIYLDSFENSQIDAAMQNLL